MRRRWVFSADDDQLIQSLYDGHRSHLPRLYRKLRKFPRWAIRRQAQRLGMTRIKEPRWSEAQEQFLREHIGIMPWLDLARRLKRTKVAVKLHAKRMGLRKSRIGLTSRSAAKLLGCDSHVITRWIARRWLPAVHRGTDRDRRNGGDMWFVNPSDLRRVITAHPEEIDLRRVDKLWFIDLLLGRHELAGTTLNWNREVSKSTADKLDAALETVMNP